MLTEAPVPTLKVSSPASLITGEELAAMGDIGRTELVKGKIIHLMPTGHPHGFYEVNLATFLNVFVRTHKLGRVLGGEVGIYTHRQPDTVRGADVAFISHQRLAQVQSKSFLDVCPELIVEVMSPDDTWSEVHEKLEEYFAVGAQLIWVVDPRRQKLHIYRSLTDLEILTVQDTLTGGEVLPGFQVPVAELFT
ncbi:MAG: Uma2 family endonuclease [Thioploca sp.]|nr:Uma2 family endonuclease [Thioploca sp.]